MNAITGIVVLVLLALAVAMIVIVIRNVVVQARLSYESRNLAVEGYKSKLAEIRENARDREEQMCRQLHAKPWMGWMYCPDDGHLVVGFRGAAVCSHCRHSFRPEDTLTRDESPVDPIYKKLHQKEPLQEDRS